MYDLLLVAGVALWGAMLAWFLRRPAASAYHPAAFYLLFHGVLFTLRPVLARLQGFDGVYGAYQFTPSPADRINALLCADLAFVTFMLVCLHVGMAPLTRAAGAAARAAEPRLTPSFWLMLVLCAPAGIASLADNFGNKVSDVSTMRMDLGTGVAVNVTGNGYFSEAMLMLGPIAVLFAWATRFRLWSFAPLALYVLIKTGTGGVGRSSWR